WKPSPESTVDDAVAIYCYVIWRWCSLSIALLTKSCLSITLHAVMSPFIALSCAIDAANDVSGSW
ncbi:Hypothetical predicted protein, partial [Olea europaea subsp. europaea]